MHYCVLTLIRQSFSFSFPFKALFAFYFYFLCLLLLHHIDSHVVDAFIHKVTRPDKTLKICIDPFKQLFCRSFTMHNVIVSHILLTLIPVYKMLQLHNLQWLSCKLLLLSLELFVSALNRNSSEYGHNFWLIEFVT